LFPATLQRLQLAFGDHARRNGLTATLRLDLREELAVSGFAEEVSGVKFALPPRLIDILLKLPIVESWAQPARDRLGLRRPVVVAQTVVSEAEGLWE